MKTTRILAFVALGFLLSGCNNDLELTAPWKDIPVVYGLINHQDTAHYIRVEKAFLDPETDAFTLAQIADSLYYDQAVVKLHDVKTGETWTLERVDGNLEGYVRQPGIFAQAPNYLYKIRGDVIDLQGGEELEFILERGDDSEPVTATTFVLEDMHFATGLPGDKLSFRYTSDTRVAWVPGPHAWVFDLLMYIHYRETDPDNPGNVLDKTVVWKVRKGIEREVSGGQPVSSVLVEFPGIEFYQFMANNIEANDAVVRTFKSIDLEVVGAGAEFKELLDISQANVGITGSQELPSYTNLSEGVGIFSSRIVLRKDGIVLTPESRDSLAQGIYTRKLNFQ